MPEITIRDDGAVSLDGIHAGSPADAAMNYPALTEEIAAAVAAWQAARAAEAAAASEPAAEETE